VKLLETSGETFEFPVNWGLDLQSEHERWLTEKKIGRPTFVIDYPKSIKAFYMRQNEDGRTVAAMDLLVPGVGEIIGGSQREEREDALRARLAELGMNPEEYWWYLELRKYGSVPHSGFGLGFDRALMYCTGMDNIRDVLPFPRTPGHVEF
jgi:asparaginyl-tRNA synthetase